MADWGIWGGKGLSIRALTDSRRPVMSYREVSAATGRDLWLGRPAAESGTNVGLLPIGWLPGEFQSAILADRDNIAKFWSGRLVVSECRPPME
jgi:hypothetical protein